jgi:hypothetical protein
LAPGERTDLQPTVRERGAGSLTVLLAGLAGLAWAGALAMLFVGGIDRALHPLAPQRVVFCALALAAGLLTFAPLEARLRLPGLTFEGAAGTFLTLYTLAFVPAPTEWLLSPPDAPVYLIFAAALFWLVSAAALPVIFSIGRRIFLQRARQYDLRRARRQAHEAGAAVAACVLLAGLRLLTPLGMLLVILIAVLQKPRGASRPILTRRSIEAALRSGRERPYWEAHPAVFWA